MDIYCKHCGEPWDTDNFHNGTNSWHRLIKLFREYGCPVAEQAMDGLKPNEISLERCTNTPSVCPEALDAIEVTQDLLGDDVDQFHIGGGEGFTL